jgi:hypothetical protein
MLLRRLGCAVLAGFALTACASTVSGQGTASSRAAAGRPAVTPTATPTGTAGPTGSAATDRAGPGSTGGPTGNGGTGAGPSGGTGTGGNGGSGGNGGTGRTKAPGRTTAPTPTTTRSQLPSRPATPTPTPESNPATVSLVGARSFCTSRQDPNGYAQLAWSTTGGTKVYILAGRQAIPSADARASGGRGPYPYNGSATLPFDCSASIDYYRIDVYGISSHGSLLVPVRNDA